MPDVKNQDGSGTVVGRREVAKGFRAQSVAPVLARRTPQAGRPGRKVVQTGVIGKGVLNEVAAGMRAMGSNVARGAQGAAKPKVALGSSMGTQRAGGAGLKAGAAGAGGLKAVKANPTAAAVGAGAGTAGTLGYQRVTKAGEWKTIDQREQSARRARRTQRRGVAAVGLGAGALATAEAKYPGATKQGIKLVRALGSKTNRQLVHPEIRRDLAMSALKTPQGMLQAGGAGLVAGGAAGWGQGRAREAYHQSKINERRKANKSKTVTKRRYDPEDERRHRQGFYAGAAATGGALATGYGVRGLARDTRNVMRTPDVPNPGELRGLRHVLNGTPYDELDDKGKATLDAKNAPLKAAHGNQKLAHEAVANLKSQKGVLWRRKPTALTLGGLAAMGGAGALQRRRHESRYD